MVIGKPAKEQLFVYVCFISSPFKSWHVCAAWLAMRYLCIIFSSRFLRMPPVINTSTDVWLLIQRILIILLTICNLVRTQVSGFKASAERGQLCRSEFAIEVRTPNQQVARADNRLPIAGAQPPARVSGAFFKRVRVRVTLLYLPNKGNSAEANRPTTRA